MSDPSTPELIQNGKKMAPEEALKLSADYLHGPIADELANDSDHFSADANKLLKFHGMYQQDNRDLRTRESKAYSLMIRGRIPGGRLTAAQYLAWDTIADQYASHTLRLTTRQSIQLHGILKGNVKETVRAINATLHSTTGACGDVVRNVTQAVNPLRDPVLSQLDGVAERLSDHFKAKSSAYAEIFLDDEPVSPEILETPSPEAYAPAGNGKIDSGDTLEPVYGKLYLPRKFKIAVTLAGDNGIDLYTNDMGFAATVGADGKLDGFFVFAGGGLGMTHNKPKTFPRSADNLGWVPFEALIPVAEAVVTAHRDYGDRTDRKHARLKYVLADRGVDWFRAEVEARSGVSFWQHELPPWHTPDYRGWRLAADATWSLGFHILTGRIIDRPGYPLKTALRELIGRYGLSVQITADQDLILMGVTAADQPAIDLYLAEAGVNPHSPAPAYDRALACVALPTCGLAITEAERYIPELLPQVQAVLDELELADRPPVIRVTGCPNGCARPYSAELGFVGRTVGVYAVYVGGDYEGTRVGRLLHEGVKTADIQPFLRRLFIFWRDNAPADERFGSFAWRTPLETLQAAVAPALSNG